MTRINGATREGFKTMMSSRRRLCVAALGPVVLLTATACGGSSAGEAAGAADAAPSGPAGSLPQVQPVAAAVKLLPAAVKERGTLTMAADLHYPPTSFLDTDDKTPIGYNVDIATLLAQSLGMKLEIKNVSFDGVIPGIAAGRYDFTATNMSPTPERLKVLDMITYWAAGSSLVTSKGNPLALSMSEQMSLCGHKIAVVTGSTQAEKYLPQISGDCQAQGKPAVDAVVLPNVQGALTQLASKRIEGVFNDTSQLAWAAKQQPQAFELFPQQYKKKVGNSIVALGVAKDSPLAPALHAAMQSLMAGPAYKAALDKWGLGTGAIPTSELLK
ncbi:ABC transporter substrate-binding protein [Terrabacter sp. GCM10028922]|uniref:ABC transporter substrate-binding protein n=1 Tax=Terrabacter sp. GCM10028922 TaxID=3273428 RepID=UPI003621B63D